MAALQNPNLVRQIKPVVKDYAWGIRGNDSRVARYALESGSIPEVDPAAPYAELWIGTHPSVCYLSMILPLHHTHHFITHTCMMRDVIGLNRYLELQDMLCILFIFSRSKRSIDLILFFICSISNFPLLHTCFSFSNKYREQQL